MKTLYIFILSCLAISSLQAQDPNFEGTWLLERVVVDLIEYFPPSNSEVSNVTLTTTTDNVTTLVCDEIESSIVNINNSSFTVVDFTTISNNCILTETINFQQVYFDSFFRRGDPGLPFSYSIEDNGNGDKSLTIENITGERAFYTSKQLNLKDFKKHSVSLFPNPAKEQLSLSAKNITITNISIFNLQGSKVMTVPFQLNEQAIDISNLQAGVYFLKAESDTGRQFVAKFVKQ